jgi:hypothetical protein
MLILSNFQLIRIFSFVNNVYITALERQSDLLCKGYRMTLKLLEVMGRILEINNTQIGSFSYFWKI